VTLEHQLYLAFQRRCRPPALPGDPSQQVIDQGSDVLRPFPQRRDIDLQHLQSVEQILPEALLADLLQEVAMRGRDHADVDGDRLFTADSSDLAFLEHAE